MTEALASARSDRVVDVLPERELDCLLVTNLINVRYLTGFTGTNGACIVSPEERVFLTDFRYAEQAGEQVRGFELVEAERDLLGELAARLAGRAGFDDQHVSVRTHERLQEKAGEKVELVAAGGLVEGLREVKDEEELRLIGEVTRLADEVYAGLRERGFRGDSERVVAGWLEAQLRERGAEPAFPAIVASGPQAARPHAEPRDVEIAPGTLVIVDMGARLDGYCSDCTRTFASGEPEGAALEVYELVRSAQARALEEVRAGIGCPELDGVAREVIEAAGHGERFGHGLGHGVGLEVHEGPRIAKTAEGELRAGNVITVEPGVYLPGELGVRIEDLVVVEEAGGSVLTSSPKELVIL